MIKVNKKKLIRSISKEVFLTQIIVESVVNAIFNQIKKEYQAGNRIEIREFGTFIPYLRKSKEYQNPKTREVSIMPTKTMLKFKCSKQLYY